jgi:hypothetical protein
LNKVSAMSSDQQDNENDANTWARQELHPAGSGDYNAPASKRQGHFSRFTPRSQPVNRDL